MAFKSKAQSRFLFALKPKIAQEFASKTKSISALPENVKKRKSPTKPKVA